jgi:hypothetical protein
MKAKLLLLFSFFSFAAFSQITFQRTYGGSGDDEGNYAQQTLDGGYILLGTTYFYGAGNGDVYLIKTNANGDVLWKKIFGYVDPDVGTALQQTTDGGYIICGRYKKADIYLIKTDSNGDTLWTKSYGGSGNEKGNSVQQTEDGGYIIAGFTNSFGAGSTDIYLLKTDVDGNLIWAKTFGGIYNEEGRSVLQCSDGGYMIAGFTDSFGIIGEDVCLIRTDINGNLQWCKTYGGSGADQSFSLQKTNDGGFIVSGYTNSFGVGGYDIYLFKVDSTGNIQWSKTYGNANNDIGFSVRQTTDSGFIIGGYTAMTSNEAYLIKTDSMGNLLWNKTYGGTGDEDARSVYQTADGGFLIFGSTLGFNPGMQEFYLVKTDNNGNSGCYEGDPSFTVTTPSTIVSTASPSVSNGGLEFNQLTIINDSCLTTVLCSSVGVDELVNENKIDIFPNPASSAFTISYVRFTISNIEMYNVIGEKVFSQPVTQNQKQVTISVTDFSPGIYFAKLVSEQGFVTRKIVVQR